MGDVDDGIRKEGSEDRVKMRTVQGLVNRIAGDVRDNGTKGGAQAEAEAEARVSPRDRRMDGWMDSSIKKGDPKRNPLSRKKHQSQQ